MKSPSDLPIIAGTEGSALPPRFASATLSVRDMAVVLLPVLAFGAAFGAAATSKGLSGGGTIAMSALVFAGASQFAILGDWRPSGSLIAVALVVFAVNSRHVILGATLHRTLAKISLPRKMAVLALLSDANWASARRAIDRGESGLIQLIVGGVLLWCGWVAGTCVGVALKLGAESFDRFGLDVVMPAFFACILIDGTKRRKDVPPWAVAAAVASALSIAWPSAWTLTAGTAAGALFALVLNVER